LVWCCFSGAPQVLADHVPDCYPEVPRAGRRSGQNLRIETVFRREAGFLLKISGLRTGDRCGQHRRSMCPRPEVDVEAAEIDGEGAGGDVSAAETDVENAGGRCGQRRR
jgi:hypothetical protein